ncbi:restriction endonuclease subunit R [Anopheles sinensis]|uniref:Restriction endonuclease subunit R n=1 Tax=Anopheles sinensis TaxID=74873 RepID=A0A084VZQ5_ANOSI|nr:restriction endonuclease subunit R [Anopheles sinensis]
MLLVFSVVGRMLQHQWKIIRGRQQLLQRVRLPGGWIPLLLLTRQVRGRIIRGRPHLLQRVRLPVGRFSLLLRERKRCLWG